MKKLIVLFIIFLIGPMCGIAAQTSSRDFYVDQQNSGHLDNYATWEWFVDATNNLVEGQRQNLTRMGLSARITWVQETTRMENELVNRAYQELPDTTRIGSAYLIMLRSYYGVMMYSVYIYSDPDGNRYYRLLRIVG
jgi:hypothetical protein